ncbi:uncharacterized protein (DUF779 family) [Arthrobacter globiformis]|uniref:DUF779 domain-containing protein n=1 Tax=Arthrobacter globiformis TaxID=1665 RepID=UPI002789F974|nr:DUF779 domain-containing protein [Arthrobacter globiformis]MDQ1059766.1 uncharacterized protein (DUF779 family) [Arthrobacter globiformis]
MPGTRLDAAVTLPGEDFSRVALTAEAVGLLRKLWTQHGPLMFHQSGGCCDGSAPMCYPAGDFRTGESDVLLGRFDLSADDDGRSGSADDGGSDSKDDGGRPLEFWMSREQFGYWSHTHLTVDVVDGRGSGFSVEAPEGKRFLIRSTLMDWPV